MIEQLKNNKTGNFFLLAGPCVIEGEEMAMRIAEKIVNITDKLGIPYVFKGSYRKANRSRLDSFMGIGDEKALKVLEKVHNTFGVPTVTFMFYQLGIINVVASGIIPISIGKWRGNKRPSRSTAAFWARSTFTFRVR